MATLAKRMPMKKKGHLISKAEIRGGDGGAFYSPLLKFGFTKDLPC